MLKELSKAKPPFKVLRFDIRYSAVRCSNSATVIDAADLV
jgi:hypothetical protein